MKCKESDNNGLNVSCTSSVKDVMNIIFFSNSDF